MINIKIKPIERRVGGFIGLSTNKIKSKIEKINEFNLEYFEIRDEITLEPFRKSNDEGRFRGFICVKVEGVRLIDNLLLN